MKAGAPPYGKPRPGVPFSRPVDVDDVADGGLAVEIEASAAECAAIAADSGLPGVLSLSAHVRIERRSGQSFEVFGELAARITQMCVVTLEPFDSDVEQDIDLSFVRVESPASERGGRRRAPPAADVVPAKGPTTPQGDDPPDPILDGIIDLGVVAFEFLMLARDLYPRKPGVEFTEVVAGETEDPEPSAFAGLQRLKDNS